MSLPAPSSPSTRDRLLDAGRALFARRGYDGASVRAITDAAGANLGAVTYHFDSKRNLYDEVADTVLAPLRESVLEAARAPGGPMDRVEGVVHAFFDVLEGSPDLPHFMLQEVAQDTEPAPAVLDTMRRVLGTLAGLVADGQRAGSMRAGDPKLMAIGIISQPVHLTLVRRHLARANLVDMAADGGAEPVRDHVVAFVRAALLRPGAAHA